jgi:hypothetical protein
MHTISRRVLASKSESFKSFFEFTKNPPRGAVALASQQDLSLQYLGAKIAFTRVPEAVEFHE